MTRLDPVQTLIAGRMHYHRPVHETEHEPTLQEVAFEMFSSCEGTFEPIESIGGDVIGYRCKRCGITASRTGRTEHGPREIRTSRGGEETLIVEPAE